MNDFDEQNEKEAAIISEAIAARLRKLDLVGLIADRRLVQQATAHVVDVLKDLKQEGLIRPSWGVKVAMDDHTLQVTFMPPLRFIPLDFVVSEPVKE